MKRTLTTTLLLLIGSSILGANANVGIPMPAGLVLTTTGSSTGSGSMSGAVMDSSSGAFQNMGVASIDDDCFDGCGQDWQPPLCGSAGTSGAVNSVVRTVATGQTIIPAT